MLKISLKAARTNANLSQKEVAELLGVSNKTVHKWEKGETSPSAKYVGALCDLYKMPYDNIDFLPTDSL